MSEGKREFQFVLLNVKTFISSRVETHVWHESFSTRDEIENFTSGRNSTRDGALENHSYTCYSNILQLLF